MRTRSYKITFGLQEGYAKNARIHTMKFAAKVIQKWMTDRLMAKQPVVAGFLQGGTLLFSGVNGDESQVIVSPSAVFAGELSSPDDIERNNKEVKNTLESLALALKNGLKQESVFIVYRDRNWCVD
jgi:hypothetical protein